MATRSFFLRGAVAGLCALLAACSHTPPPPPPAPPPKVATLCGAASALSPADAKAVCGTRAALREMELPDAWRDTGGPVARVMLIPAAQAALSIRVIGNTMTVKRISRGTIDVARVVSLSAAERQALIDAGAKTWAAVGPNADAPTFAACKSANYVVAETNLNGDVKFAVSHCVALKPLRDLADAYLAIAGEKVPELRQGLEQSLD